MNPDFYDWFKETVVMDNMWKTHDPLWDDSTLDAVKKALTNQRPVTKVSVNLNDTLKKELTKEEQVIALVKGGFEKMTGLSLDEFFDIYQQLIDEKPEKLI